MFLFICVKLSMIKICVPYTITIKEKMKLRNQAWQLLKY